MGLFGGSEKGSSKGLNFSDRMNYVDDYSVEQVTDERGKTRKKVRYNGIWYCMKGEEKTNRLKLILAALIGCASAVMLFFLLIQEHIANIWPTVVLPRGLAMFPMFYLLMGVSELPFGLKPMERAKYYHSFIRISRSSVGVMALVAVSLGATLVFRIVYKDWSFMKGEITTLSLALLIIGMLFALIKLLYSIDIDEKPNGAYKSELK